MPLISGSMYTSSGSEGIPVDNNSRYPYIFGVRELRNHTLADNIVSRSPDFVLSNTFTTPLYYASQYSNENRYLNFGYYRWNFDNIKNVKRTNLIYADSSNNVLGDWFNSGLLDTHKWLVTNGNWMVTDSGLVTKDINAGITFNYKITDDIFAFRTKLNNPWSAKASVVVDEYTIKFDNELICPYDWGQNGVGVYGYEKCPSIYHPYIGVYRDLDLLYKITPFNYVMGTGYIYEVMAGNSGAYVPSTAIPSSIDYSTFYNSVVLDVYYNKNQKIIDFNTYIEYNNICSFYDNHHIFGDTRYETNYDVLALSRLSFPCKLPYLSTDHLIKFNTGDINHGIFSIDPFFFIHTNAFGYFWWEDNPLKYYVDVINDINEVIYVFSKYHIHNVSGILSTPIHNFRDSNHEGLNTLNLNGYNNYEHYHGTYVSGYIYHDDGSVHAVILPYITYPHGSGVMDIVYIDTGRNIPYKVCHYLNGQYTGFGTFSDDVVPGGWDWDSPTYKRVYIGSKNQNPYINYTSGILYLTPNYVYDSHVVGYGYNAYFNKEKHTIYDNKKLVLPHPVVSGNYYTYMSNDDYLYYSDIEYDNNSIRLGKVLRAKDYKTYPLSFFSMVSHLYPSGVYGGSGMINYNFEIDDLYRLRFNISPSGYGYCQKRGTIMSQGLVIGDDPLFINQRQSLVLNKRLDRTSKQYLVYWAGAHDTNILDDGIEETLADLHQHDAGDLTFYCTDGFKYKGIIPSAPAKLYDVGVPIASAVWDGSGLFDWECIPTSTGLVYGCIAGSPTLTFNPVTKRATILPTPSGDYFYWYNQSGILYKKTYEYVDVPFTSNIVRDNYDEYWFLYYNDKDVLTASSGDYSVYDPGKSIYNQYIHDLHIMYSGVHPASRVGMIKMHQYDYLDYVFHYAVDLP